MASRPHPSSLPSSCHARLPSESTNTHALPHGVHVSFESPLPAPPPPRANALTPQSVSLFDDISDEAIEQAMRDVETQLNLPIPPARPASAAGDARALMLEAARLRAELLRECRRMAHTISFVAHVASCDGPSAAEEPSRVRLRLILCGRPPHRLDEVLSLYSLGEATPCDEAQQSWDLPLTARANGKDEAWQPLLARHYSAHAFPHAHSMPSQQLLSEMASVLSPPVHAAPPSLPPPAAPPSPHTAEDASLHRIPPALRATLHPFQLEAVRFALHRGGRVLLADEMGLGKSFTALAIAAVYAAEGPLLVLCPSSMREVWLSLVEQWLPIPPGEINVLRRRYDMCCARKVTILSYRMLTTFRAPLLRLNTTTPFATVILDESHTLKEARRVESEAAARERSGAYETICKLCGVRERGSGGDGAPRARLVLLSGTPMERDPDSLYEQLHLLRPHVFSSYDGFGGRYCSGKTESRWAGKVATSSRYRKAGHYFGVSLLPRDELRLYLQSCVMIRRNKSTPGLLAAPLPPVVRQQLSVRLSCAQQEVIHSVQEKLLTLETSRTSHRILRGVLRQLVGLAKAGASPCRLRQLLEANRVVLRDGCLDDDEAAAPPAHDPSPLPRRRAASGGAARGEEEESCSPVGWLHEMVRSLGRRDEKMLLFAHHKAVVDALAVLLADIGASEGVELFVRLDGSVPTATRAPLVARFNADPSLRVALLSIKAMGTGVTLTSASIAIFWEVMPMWVDHYQAEARAHRIGQEKAQVDVYYVTAAGSIDESSYASLLRQQRHQRLIEGPGDGLGKESKGGEGGRRHGAEAGQRGGEGKSGVRAGRRSWSWLLEKGAAECSEGGEAEESETSGVGGGQNDVEIEVGGEAEGAEDEEEEEAPVGFSFWPSRWSDRASLFLFDPTREMFRLAEAPPTDRYAFLNFSIAAAADGALDEEMVEACLCLSASDEAAQSSQESCDAEDVAAALGACKRFALQWQALHPARRHQLSELALKLRRPLRLPLSVELRRASERHRLAFEPSTRRHTSRDDFGAAAAGGGAPTLSLQWRERRGEPMEWRVHAADGGWRCYYCHQPCDAAGGGCEEGSPFCSAACVDNWAVQVGAGNATRAVLFCRERGVCQACARDCHMLWLRLLPLDAARRRRLLSEALPGLTARRRERVVRWCHEGDLWQADHKLAVADGGGETRADDGNLQTLCVPCHQEKTAQERLGRRGGEPKKQSRKRPLEKLGLTDVNPSRGELSE